MNLAEEIMASPYIQVVEQRTRECAIGVKFGTVGTVGNRGSEHTQTHRHLIES